MSQDLELTTLASGERDQEIVRRTAELLAANLPMAEFFERMCSLLRRFVDAHTVLLALHAEDGPVVEFLGAGDRVGKPAEAVAEADSWIARAVREGEPLLLKRKEEF